MAQAQRLITADYNGLSNIPIINASLPVLPAPPANTYFRHTGSTTGTFTKGVIYKWDGTEYKELGAGAQPEPIDLSKYIQADTLTGLLPNVQYALVHNSDNVFTLVEVEGGGTGTGWLIATSDAEAEALLINDNLGKFFMFIGESESEQYYNYALYQVVDNEGTLEPALIYVSADDIESLLNDKQDVATLEQDVAALGFTKNAGTMTGIIMNGESKQVENGVVDLGTVITEHQSLDDYYTKSEVDTALDGKQDTLESGVNIKTINNESILGEGNIQIDGVTDYDELENQPIINQYEESEPAPVNGKYYKRPDGNLYKYVEAIVPEHLIALEHNKEVHKGFKVRFNKNLDIDTFLNGLTFPEGYPMLQLYNIGFADGEHDNEDALEQLAIMDAGAMSAKLGEDAKGIILVAGIDRILYATESGAIMGVDAITKEAMTISYTQGWNTDFVDENGDYEPQFISAVYDENPHYSTFEDGILGISNQLNQELWNGVLVGEFVSTEDKSFYDKVVLESELEEGGGLPDSKDAKNLDTLRVKITPEEVAFLHPVETVTGGTTNDIFINTNATIDFSKFNFTDSVGGMPCEELIKLNFPAKVISFGVNLGNRLYKVYGDNSYMTDTTGTSIANICSSYWNLVNNPQTDNNGFYFVEVLSDANDSQSKSPLRLYKFDNDGSDVWVLIYNCESSMNYGLYINYWVWSSDDFSITVDKDTINFRQGDRNSSMSDGMYFDDDVQLAVSTSLFNNFLFVSPAAYFDIVAMNYDGAQMLTTMVGMGSEDYDMSSDGLIWASASLKEGMEPGWSPYLEYATGSHENGIISYLRGFLPMITSGGESIIGEDDPVPNNITYVSSNPVVHNIFGASRDVEVLVPEKKEIGWGLPFPDIKKAGQVLMTAGDEYALTYDNYQATHGVITAVDGFTFNTGLDQATVDANVITLGMRAKRGMEPIKATIMSPYMEYSVAFTMAVPLANFEVGQTTGENAGMLIDISKFSDMKAYLNNLGLTSGSPDYPLLVVDKDGTSINALYATYDTDNSRVALMTSGGQEILNTDDESYDHEPFAGLESGATITNIYDGAIWNGVFFYSFEEDEGSMKGAILGGAKDLTAGTSTTEIMYSTVTGDAVIMNLLAQSEKDRHMIVHNLEHRWYEENFNLLNFSGVCQFKISDRYRGGESIYGVLVTLQPGVFYGDIGNAHVEWGDASGKVNPEDYETSSTDELYYLMGEGHNGEDLKRYNYNDVKSDINSYVSNNIQLKTINNNSLKGYGNINVPTYYTGSFTLYSSNWSSYNDGYRYTYSFSYNLYDNDTLMVAPADATSATRAQEANVYFAEPSFNGSSQIYFYASEQPQYDIGFKYTMIDQSNN